MIELEENLNKRLNDHQHISNQDHDNYVIIE